MKGVEKIKNLRLSIFTKIFVVFVLASLLLVAIFAFGHRYLFVNRVLPQLKNNSINYCNFIIDRIGTPPDTIQAKLYCDSLDIRAKIQGPGIYWQSSAELPDLKAMDSPQFSHKQFRVGFHQGLYVQIQRSDFTYLVHLETRNKGFQYVAEIYALTMILLSVIIMFCVFLFVRYLLKPINILKTGVRELSEGHLDYQMFTPRNDELGDLIQSFNSMSGRLKEMIQAKEKLLLDVSHELRSPLTRVKVALEFLAESSAKKNIHEDIAEMETMLTELLESARLNSPHGGVIKKTVNLSNIIREIIDSHRDIQPGIKLLSLPEEIVLNLDRKRIETLFNNVFSNALKYSGDDSFPVEISAREGHGEIVITIQDFGSGIPAAHLPFIFEPFYRVDRSRSKETGGYGLGMSLSKKIMETHGGKIELSSTPGAGTTVYLKFKR